MPMDIKHERIWVPCGKCNFCLQNRRNEWAFRIGYEIKRSQTAHFITLTYANENLPLLRDEQTKATYMVLNKPDIQHFHKLLKQAQNRQFKKDKKPRSFRDKWKIKYYAVGEYGTKGQRPHYHSIIFNIHPDVMRKIKYGEIWTKGEIHRGEVNDSTIQYTAKYVIDAKRPEWTYDPRPKPFATMSKGIGEAYIEKRKQWHTDADRLYVSGKGGIKIRMPRYYKDKIFNETERARIGKMAAEEQEKLEDKKIEELIKQFGNEFDALRAYNEQIRVKHESIKTKSHKLNKF